MENKSQKNDSFTCVFCELKFSNKNMYLDHFRSHANDPIKKSKRKSTQPIQIQRPSTNSSIDCDICCEKFSNITEAIKHKHKKHPRAMDRFYCPYCGKLFTIKGIYENHIKSHSEDGLSVKQVLICSYCSAVFCQDKALEYHIQTAHQRVMKVVQPMITAPPSKKIKYDNAGNAKSVFYCHLCGSEYIVKFNLQKHLESHHSEEDRHSVPQHFIKCTICEAIFYNQTAYETHNLNHRPDDLYVENEEQRLLTVTRVDQDFDIRRVVSNQPNKKHKSLRLPDKIIDKEEEELSPPSTPDESDSDD